ncbi:putative integral membrane protein/predicted DNA-binding antitoxin AbrB/MazE fold protein [Paenibacillus sp. V4I3]|uniref:S-layer homology domain-containing protein n=1 Tax=Paenibacillus sp. V4I3 TaxID=3042305 RepID=UPI002784003E|nr:S-layer homology domain-containing protein [Paenibacillus sp. V4I3]MDQ0878077.1 putative integral membrane protein/predicted DNA-binding antitoxin AbrB/MazE fold protein [Paenibacillus sp. V4I3]
MTFKKIIATGLAFIMIMGSGTAVLAKDNGNKKDDSKVEIHLTFDDLQTAEWAIRYIASLASKRVFEGYEDGTFKPHNTVSRIEAITAAVRLMGLRSQAESSAEMSTHLNFKDADKVPSWAVGYVAVALENDLFSENDDMVQPQKEGDRLWATTLLVKALKLDAQAKAKMNTTLPFKDAKQIPAGAVGYVAVAIEKGLVDGFEDNTFRPNQPVTRAQLAALLDRTGGQLPDQGNNTMNGTVSRVVTNNTLSITSSGTTSTYPLHPDVFIYRNGAKVNASALQVGDVVKVRTFNGQIVFIEVTNAVQSIIYSGTVSAAVTNNTLTLTKSGATSTLPLHPDVVVYRNGIKVSAYDLKVGDEVNIRTSDNKVIYIEVTKSIVPISSSGTVSATVSNNVLKLTKSGVTTSYTLHPDVVIYRNGVKVNASSLLVGDEVNVRTSDNKVIFIEVTQTAQAITNSGTVSAVVSNNVLKLQKSGVTFELTLHADVIVYRNGLKVNASDLKVGDEVNIRTTENKVIYIEVTKMVQPITNNGTVSSLVSNNELKLTKSGVTTVFTLHPDVVVYRNGVKVRAVDLKVGDEVDIRTSDNKVIYIEVTKMIDANLPFELLGKLKGTTLNAQGELATISITQTINGREQTTIYQVSSGVTLSGNLALFKEGNLIQLKGVNRLVTSITIK